MSSERKKIISQKAAEYMKECGVPNNLQSKLLYDVCELIRQNDDPEINSDSDVNFDPLIAEIDIVDNKYWNLALKLVLDFLNENQMDNTLATIKIENNDIESFDAKNSDNLISLDELIQLSHSLKGKTLREKVDEFMTEIPIKIKGDMIKELNPDIQSSDSEQLESMNFDDEDFMDQKYDE